MSVLQEGVCMYVCEEMREGERERQRERERERDWIVKTNTVVLLVW